MRACKLPILTFGAFPSERAHPPYPPCACAHARTRRGAVRARARTGARTDGFCEQPSDPRAEVPSMPRGNANDAYPGREHSSKQGLQGRRFRGCQGLLCTLARCKGQCSFTCDARYEGSSIQRVVGVRAQPTAVLPCDAATLGQSIRACRACAQAHLASLNVIGASATGAEKCRHGQESGALKLSCCRVRAWWRRGSNTSMRAGTISRSTLGRLHPFAPVRTPLADVASLARHWPTLPTSLVCRGVTRTCASFAMVVYTQIGTSANSYRDLADANNRAIRLTFLRAKKRGSHGRSNVCGLWPGVWRQPWRAAALWSCLSEGTSTMAPGTLESWPYLRPGTETVRHLRRVL